MKERDLQTRFNAWLRNRWQGGSAAFELKICHEESMPFSEVKEHQVRNLQIAKHGSLAYKIPDVGMDQKPFDCIFLDKVPAYVAVMFHKRGEKRVYLIDVDIFALEAETSARRSLTPLRASQIGQVVIVE